MRPTLTFALLVTASLFCMPATGIAKDEKQIESPTSQTESELHAKETEAERIRQEKAEKAEAARLARLEREKQAERERVELERQCVIKPVMTDAEIARCKEVWR